MAFASPLKLTQNKFPPAWYVLPFFRAAVAASCSKRACARDRCLPLDHYGRTAGPGTREVHQTTALPYRGGRPPLYPRYRAPSTLPGCQTPGTESCLPYQAHAAQTPLLHTRGVDPPRTGEGCLQPPLYYQHPPIANSAQQTRTRGSSLKAMRIAHTQRVTTLAKTWWPMMACIAASTSAWISTLGFSGAFSMIVTTSPAAALLFFGAMPAKGQTFKTLGPQHSERPQRLKSAANCAEPRTGRGEASRLHLSGHH